MKKIANASAQSHTQNTKISQPKAFRRLFYSVLATCAIGASIAGCTSGKWGFPYRAPVQQGNWITAEEISLLQQGMSPQQVLYALGSPTLVDIFHPERWEYPYYFKPGYGDPVVRRFSVWFANGVLDRWEGDEQPDYQPADYHTQQLTRTVGKLSGSSSAADSQGSKAEQSSKVEPSQPAVTTTPLPD